MREQNNRYQQTATANDIDTLNNILSMRQLNSTVLQRSQQLLLTELASINQRLAKAREDYNYWFNEGLLKRTGKDGRPPTEGPKYQRAVATYSDLNQQIEVLQASLVDTKTKLDTLNPELESALVGLNQVQKDINDYQITEANYQQNKQSIKLLEDSLLSAKNLLTKAIDEKHKKMDIYREKLDRDGLFYTVKTGVLRRYQALKRIHADPEIGEAANLFSWLLKLFFIAIELMPVIIKLFFSPFSFYSLKMYRKMQIALLEEQHKLEVAKAKHHSTKELAI